MRAAAELGCGVGVASEAGCPRRFGRVARFGRARVTVRATEILVDTVRQNFRLYRNSFTFRVC